MDLIPKKSVKGRLWIAAHAAYAEFAADSLETVRGMLSDRPDLLRGLEGWYQDDWIKGALLDKETLIQVITEGLEYDDGREARDAARKKFYKDQEDAYDDFKISVRDKPDADKLLHMFKFDQRAAEVAFRDATYEASFCV